MKEDDIKNLKNKIDSILDKLPKSDNSYKRLENHKEMLSDSKLYLESLKHTVAFIGSVGVGKTSAICNLLDLQENNEPLLKTGSGRTTVCEVEIKEGEELGILVQPYEKKEIFSYLEEFAYHITGNKDGTIDFELSSEIERALRNMLGLKIKRKRDSNGKIKKIDPAVELYKKISNPNEFFNKLKALINLENRTLINIKPKSKDTESWISGEFLNINNGLNKNVSLPKKIIIKLNRKLMDSDIKLSVIDTKGVDQTANREDIDYQLKNSRNISILCTKFNDAPDKVTETLLTHMKDSGLIDYIEERVIILVLDRDNEAESIADLDEPDLEEGRFVREEQIQKDLEHSLKINKVDIIFFNSKKDNGCELLKKINTKLDTLRNIHSNRLALINEAVDSIEESANTQLAKDSESAVKESVLAWIKKAIIKKTLFKKKFSALSKEIQSKSTHASSLRGSVNRNGVWNNFNYYLTIRNLYRYQVVADFDLLRTELIAILENMESQSKYCYSLPLISQVKNTTNKRLEEIYTYSSNLADNNFKESLFEDTIFWTRLQSEWGKGSGYKDRIASQTENWFIEQDYKSIENLITKSVNDSWDRFLNEVSGLFSEN